MRTPPFELHLPTTLDEAVELAAQYVDTGFDWIAGGTDLLPNYKWHINCKPHVISLAKIAGLDTISATEIGAMARLSDLETSETLHPLVKQAAGKVASSLIRKNATLGGNLCLDTRCYWFNQGEEWRSSIDWCHKCDCGTGSDCRVIPNQNDLCVATYQGDIAPTLLVLGAAIHLLGPQGQREMLLSDFYKLDGMTRNVLQSGEMVVKITLPDSAASMTGSYQKLRLRDSWDFPEAGVAAAWVNNDASTLKVATTALESIPRLHDEEVEKSQGDVSALCAAIHKVVKPVNNTSMPPSYRRAMVKVLVKRACEGL